MTKRPNGSIQLQVVRATAESVDGDKLTSGQQAQQMATFAANALDAVVDRLERAVAGIKAEVAVEH